MAPLIEQLLAHRFRGLGRLRSMLRGPYPVTLVRVQTRDGIELALDPKSWIDFFIIRDGYYEREVLDAILAHLPSHGVLWDVGANIGLHALSAKHFRPDIVCVAFEPVPFTAARLMINTELSSLAVELLPISLGETPGYAPMSVKLRGNSGLSSLRPWGNVSYDSAFLCRVESGDALVAAGSIQAPNVIKMDVEGSELAVLTGLTNLLGCSDLKAVIFESDGELLPDISHILRAHRFLVEPLAPANPLEVCKPVNYLAARA